jgi:hypothetical protein
MSHAPRIDTDSMESRLYRLLAERAGQWVTADEIMRECLTTALSTHISHVRERVRVLGWRVESGMYIRESGRIGRRYRLYKLGDDPVQPRYCEVCRDPLGDISETDYMKRLGRCGPCAARLAAGNTVTP